MSLRLILFVAPLLLVLQQMRPGLRLVLGAIGVVVGTVEVVAAPLGWPPDAAGSLIFAAGLMALTGGWGVWQRYAMHRDLRRAEARWPELHRGLDALGERESPVRYLVEHGVRRYEVRKLLLRRWRGEHGPTADPTVASTSGSSKAAGMTRKWRIFPWRSVGDRLGGY